MNHTIKISDFSPHLFWDIDSNKLSLSKNKKIIIKRVLDYGLLRDWELLKTYYGITHIAQIAQSIKDLDKKSAVFISTLAKIPRKKFSCFITKPLTPLHWNF